VPWEIRPLGDSALIVRVGGSLAEVLSTAQKLVAARLPGVVEVAPAFASVALFLESPRELESCRQILRGVLRRRSSAPEQNSPPRLVEIPVCYEPGYGLDLEVVAQHSRLSPNEIAQRHAHGEYRVRCLGFTPGFPYLGGLPRVLSTPRRDAPRTRVPAGSVAIGGALTGIYPLSSPGGWNIIGRTPLRLFDAAREPAALLQAGDRVRFFAIGEEEFERWEK
jgi:KipI family sensor histidine kinase inhibitor